MVADDPASTNSEIGSVSGIAKATLIATLEGLISSLRFDAIDLAKQHCGQDDGNPSCAHYHGIRFLLHYLGARAILNTQYAVFYTHLQNRFQSDNCFQNSPTVLISGAADFVIPALVSSALKDLGLHAKLTILDRCQTPLVLCQKAARKFGFDWCYQQSGILEYRTDQHFDLICSDRFLGHLAAETRLDLLNKWATLLTTVGTVLTTVSIRPQGQVSHTESNSLVDRLQSLDDHFDPGNRYSPQELADMVVTYSRNRSAYPILNQQAILSLFESSQLEIASINRLSKFDSLPIKKDPYKLIQIFCRKRTLRT